MSDKDTQTESQTVRLSAVVHVYIKTVWYV